MSYTVWRRGLLMGHMDLAMPSPGPNVRVGQLTPTVDFELAWPELGSVVDEVAAAGMVVGSAVADLPPDWIPAADIARELEQARKEGLEIRAPSYIVVVLEATESPNAA